MPPAYEILLLNTAIPQIQAAQSGDTYVVPRDIAFSAALTLSAGTANGVPYLNASKVVTTGSALTFDGSEIFKNSGGTIQHNDVRGSAAAGTRLSAGGTLGVDSFDLFQNAVGGYVFNRGNTPLILGTNNAERARITSTGEFQWKPNGTTQAMTLDASGNLGLGTTSPKNNTGYANFTLNNATNGGVVEFCQADTTIGQLFFDGNGGTLRTSNNKPMLFGTNGSERARITSGGYFKASNSGAYNNSTGSYHELYSNASGDWIGYFTQATASNPNGVVIQYTAAAPNGTGNTFLYCNDNAAVRATIRSNGGLANYQSNNVDLSDARTKTDISPLGSYWNKIAGLEIVTYKYKDQTHDDLNIGVIAQQVEAVAPEFVDSDGFGDTPEDGVPLKTIYNKDLTFAAIKALQEAMARIETLEAKIAALEAK